MDEDFISRSGGLEPSPQAFVVPAPSPRTRRNGAPIVLGTTVSSKAGPPGPHTGRDDRGEVGIRHSDLHPSITSSIISGPTLFIRSSDEKTQTWKEQSGSLGHGPRLHGTELRLRPSGREAGGNFPYSGGG